MHLFHIAIISFNHKALNFIQTTKKLLETRCNSFLIISHWFRSNFLSKQSLFWDRSLSCRNLKKKQRENICSQLFIWKKPICLIEIAIKCEFILWVKERTVVINFFYINLNSRANELWKSSRVLNVRKIVESRTQWNFIKFHYFAVFSYAFFKFE